jgi:hypothetical protein
MTKEKNSRAPNSGSGNELNIQWKVGRRKLSITEKVSSSCQLTDSRLRSLTQMDTSSFVQRRSTAHHPISGLVTG